MDLKYHARKYIWWQPPEAAVADAHRVIAQVMNFGTFEDVQALLDPMGQAAFGATLKEARPGEFSDPSWHYWHLVLGIAQPGKVPTAPVRRFG